LFDVLVGFADYHGIGSFVLRTIPIIAAIYVPLHAPQLRLHALANCRAGGYRCRASKVRLIAELRRPV